MKKYLLLILIIFSLQPLKAQITKDYFFKSWDLSYINPAALTQPGGLKANIQYNQDELKNVRVSEGGQFQLHTDIDGKHGVGVTFQNQRSGILTGSGIGAGYGYRVQLAEQQSLAIGSRFNYFKHSINRSDVIYADPSDPSLNGDLIGQNNILINTGLFYQNQQFQAGIMAPEIIPIKGATYYKRNLTLYLDYTFKMNDILNLRPNFYYENLTVIGDWYEMGLFTTYNNLVSLELAYTSESAFRVKGGLNYQGFDFGYGFETGNTTATDVVNKRGHRIYLAYNFGSNKQKSGE